MKKSIVKSKRAIRKPNSRFRQEEVSSRTIAVMLILVLVFSILSIGLYAYAFYQKNGLFDHEQPAEELQQDLPAVSGMATISIIKPPEGK